MKIIINYELAKRSESQLKGLFTKLSRDLVTTERGTPERRNILASMENVRRKIAVVHVGNFYM